MPLTRNICAIAALSLGLAAPIAAEAFEKVSSKSEFVQLVQGKKLSLTGIKLDVTPAGNIKGKAYGYPVTGEWQWRGGYFCRSLYWGEKDLGPNCQQVETKAGKIRFTSDRGAGRSAVLSLR